MSALRTVWVNACPICGRDVARVHPVANGFAVFCDPEGAGCGAASHAAASEALAVEKWNQVPSPAARAVAQAARDRDARRGVQHA